MKNFSERLIELLNKRNLTHKELSIGIDVSERLIRYYVAGTKQPTTETLIKMSNFFECSIDYIVGLTDNPKRC